MKKYTDLKNSEHLKLLFKITAKINKEEIKSILDAGSGKTSLSILLRLFPESKIDAITYYNDLRKINSIKENIFSSRYNLEEKNLCKDKIKKQYDLVLAHLLLGEAEKWNHSFKELLLKLTQIKTTYLIIFDIKEDPVINYQYLEKIVSEKFILVKKEEMIKNKQEQYPDFLAKTYVAYLFKRKLVTIHSRRNKSG